MWRRIAGEPLSNSAVNNVLFPRHECPTDGAVSATDRREGVWESTGLHSPF
jgi:hypothetical protein